VVEITEKGYTWSEFLPRMGPPGSAQGECWMFPDSAPKSPIGHNIRGFVNRSLGTEANK